MITKHLKYLKYMARHKWYVFKACLRYGLILRGIIHDWSKFLPSEWIPYANHFYGNSSVPNREDDLPYETAWNYHQKRNKHHWQYWVVLMDKGGHKALPMPNKYRKEMLSDWIGAGMAITGKLDISEWYYKNRDVIILHPETRAWIEEEINKIDPTYINKKNEKRSQKLSVTVTNSIANSVNNYNKEESNGKVLQAAKHNVEYVVLDYTKERHGSDESTFNRLVQYYETNGGSPTLIGDEVFRGVNCKMVQFPKGLIDYFPLTQVEKFFEISDTPDAKTIPSK